MPILPSPDAHCLQDIGYMITELNEYINQYSRPIKKLKKSLHGCYAICDTPQLASKCFHPDLKRRLPSIGSLPMAEACFNQSFISNRIIEEVAFIVLLNDMLRIRFRLISLSHSDESVDHHNLLFWSSESNVLRQYNTCLWAESLQLLRTSVKRTGICSTLNRLIS